MHSDAPSGGGAALCAPGTVDPNGRLLRMCGGNIVVRMCGSPATYLDPWNSASHQHCQGGQRMDRKHSTGIVMAFLSFYDPLF